MNASELLGKTHELFLQQERGQLSPQVQFPLLLSERTIPQGHINSNIVVCSPNQRLYILRHENIGIKSSTVSHIKSEYEGIGFLKNPQNGFRIRNAEDQQLFTKRLQSIGILVPDVHYAKNGLQVIEFLPDAISLSDLWLQNHIKSPEATKNVIATIMRMHQANIVAGDRWGPNELVTPNGDVYLVDFDVEIWGPDAKEFDIANLLYHTSYFVQAVYAENLSVLKNLYLLLLTNPIIDEIYNKKKLLQYIKNYAEFFASDKARGSPLYYRWCDPQEGIAFFDSIIQTVNKSKK